MDKQKEIEKILEVMHSNLYLTHSDCAIALVNAGYGDVKQAVREFAERIKMAFYIEFDELIPSIMSDKIDELVKEVCGE